MTRDTNTVLEQLATSLEEKIQSPSTPKGLEAYVKSLTSWSKAASKVAGSYRDRLRDAKPKSDAAQVQQAQLDKLLQAVSGELAQISDLAGKLKGGK